MPRGGKDLSPKRKEIPQKAEAVIFMAHGQTITFTIPDGKEEEMHKILRSVYDSMSEKGYNPINQIVGYLLSEDPTYITNHNGARSLISKIDRDELLNALVRSYLGLK